MELLKKAYLLSSPREYYWLIDCWHNTACLHHCSRFQKAIDIYEEIARHSLTNNLLKYGVKGHLLNAGLCQLCKGDHVAISNALERYQVSSATCCFLWLHPCDRRIQAFHILLQDLDPTFSGTRECRLLQVLFIDILAHQIFWSAYYQSFARCLAFGAASLSSFIFAWKFI